MQTSLEKGLASHSFIMVASQELTGDYEEGWTVVSTKKTLQRLRNISKNNTTKIKSSNSKTSDDIANTTTSRTAKESSNEVQFIKSIKNQVYKKITSDPSVVSPLQVITVPFCDNNSSVDSLFHEDESIVEEQEDKDKEIIQVLNYIINNFMILTIKNESIICFQQKIAFGLIDLIW